MNSKLIIIGLFTFFPLLVNSQSNLNLQKTKFHSNKVFEDEFGYVQAIQVDNIIYISGIAAKGEMSEAISKVYDRLEKILSSYNLTFNNVVRETIFTTRFDELVRNKDVRKKYYNGEYPTSTWVQIERLYSPEAVIEVEFTAVSNNRSNMKRKQNSSADDKHGKVGSTKK
jgi:2-iminobutanoate/2-iminopropanoate deaminase